MDKRVILIGRHVTDPIPGVEIVAQESVVWPQDEELAGKKLNELQGKATQIDAYLLFQNIPGILAVALVQQAQARWQNREVGVIISKQPDVRPADNVVVLETSVELGGLTLDWSRNVIDAVRIVGGTATIGVDGMTHVNQTAKIPFEFVKIVWF